MRFLLLLALAVTLVSCDQSFFGGSTNQFTGARSNTENDTDKRDDTTQNPVTGVGEPDPDNPNPTDPDPTKPIEPTETGVAGIGPNPLSNFFSGLSTNAKLTCDHQNITTTVTGPRDSSNFSFSGEFCPQSYESMSIEIIVDQSGSMATADPDRLLLGCGRNNAVKAIIEKIKRTIVNQSDTQKSDIEIGLITFDSDARNEIPHTNIENFESELNETTGLFFGKKIDLCKANIDDGPLSGFTNYEAALNLARQKVSSARFNKKVVIFITDGVASVSSNYTPSFVLSEYERINFNGNGNFPNEVVNLFEAAHQDGKIAADNLRNTFNDDFSMFALYLNGDERDTIQLRAEEKIAEIVDGERDQDYFLVNRADALTDAALKIAFPVVPINTSSASFIVSTDGNSQNLSLAKPLTATLVDRYEFETQTKKLVPGENIFQVEATDVRGNKHTGKITVNFEPND